MLVPYNDPALVGGAGFDARLSQRAKVKENAPDRLRNPLEMNDVKAGQYYGGKLPNTPLVVAIISFLLGGVCLSGFSLFVTGGNPGHWWTSWQLGFFVQSWAFFHWAEFAVTAGWNRPKCNVDCECFGDVCSAEYLKYL